MRKEFKKLKDLLLISNIYDENTNDCIFNDVMYLVDELETKMLEIEKRMECAKNTNKDIRSIKTIYEDVISFDDLEILERSVNDVDIALDLNDAEPIENDWYGLFGTRNGNENVPRETLEAPPTDLCKTPQTHEFVKDIIAKLKVIDVDGETMQYILEQVGMDEQMHRQLVLKKHFQG